MGCIICNILEIEGRKPDYEKCIACVDVDNTERDEQLVKEIIEEMCNDIAINHPEMVKRIHVIELARNMQPSMHASRRQRRGSRR